MKILQHKIPDTWQWIEISQIGNIETGTTPSKKDKNNYGVDFPFYKPTELEAGINVRESRERLSKKGIKKARLLPKNSILVTCIGATIGKTGIIRNEGASNQQINSIIPVGSINPNFVYYQVICPFFQNQIIKRSSSTTLPILNKSRFSKLLFALPSQKEQNRIVEKIEELLSDLDKATEELKKTQEQLKIYRQAVLKAAFEGKLTEKWRRNNPNEKNYLEKIHRSIKNFNFMKTGQDVPRRLPTLDFLCLPSLPDNWLWIEAHKICTSVRDGTHDTPKYIENGIPLITSKNLKNGKIDFNNVQFISKRDHKEIIKRSIVENDDTLFGMIGTIGNPVIVKCKKEFSIKNVGLFKKSYDYIIPKYLRYWLESSILFKIFKEKDFIKGTTQKFISLGYLRILPIPLSSLEEQYEIVNEIESRLSVCDKLEETVGYSLNKIEYLRQSILKKAFKGKLVPQDPNGEPAEKLLERIKQEKEKFESNNKKRKKR